MKIYIDVREPNEFEQSHYPGAINIPLGTLNQNTYLGSLDKSTEIIVYCRSGNRSEQAKSILSTQGFENVTNGINEATIKSAN